MSYAEKKAFLARGGILQIFAPGPARSARPSPYSQRKHVSMDFCFTEALWPEFVEEQISPAIHESAQRRGRAYLDPAIATRDQTALREPMQHRTHGIS